MRRLVVLTVLAIGLAVPAAGLAVVGASDDGTLSVKNAAGKILLAPFNGSAIGRVGQGRVAVTDPVLSDGVGFDFWGCDNKIEKSETTTVCTGNNIRFRAIGGSYKIFVKGSGISLSAVGRGTVLLDGLGEEPDFHNDGVFSLNDGAYRSLPDIAKPLPLAAPAGG